MERQLLIRDVYAREILDPAGNLTIETEVLAGEDAVGRASAPSGVFFGRYDTKGPREEGGPGAERYCQEQRSRDQHRRDQCCRDRGVREAAENINSRLADEIIGINVFCQDEIDRILTRAQRNTDKNNLETNALLSISVAAARAACMALKLPLYRYLGGIQAVKMPAPVMNIINSGPRGNDTAGIRRFLIVPAGESVPFCEQLRMCAGVYRSVETVLRERGYPAAVGEDGAFITEAAETGDVLRILRDAAERLGYRMGRELSFALSAETSGIYDPQQAYIPDHGKDRPKTAEEMIKYYEDLSAEFPVCSIADPLDREDWKGWQMLTERIGSRVQLAGGALFDADAERIRKGSRLGAANAVLIRLDRIPTLTEVVKVVRTAQEAGYRVALTCCPGETEDVFAADIAAALGIGQIWTGAPCHSEQTAKYNRLLRIGETLWRPGAEKALCGGKGQKDIDR